MGHIICSVFTQFQNVVKTRLFMPLVLIKYASAGYGELIQRGIHLTVLFNRLLNIVLP